MKHRPSRYQPTISRSCPSWNHTWAPRNSPAPARFRHSPSDEFRLEPRPGRILNRRRTRRTGPQPPISRPDRGWDSAPRVAGKERRPGGETSGWEAARVSQHESGDDAGRGDGTRGRGFSGPGHPGRPIGAIEFVTENASCGKTNNGGGGRARRKRARVRAEHGSRETSSSYGFGGGFRRGGAYHLVSRASRPVRPCARLTESEVTTFSPSRFFFF